MVRKRRAKRRECERKGNMTRKGKQWKWNCDRKESAIGKEGVLSL